MTAIYTVKKMKMEMYSFICDIDSEVDYNLFAKMY